MRIFNILNIINVLLAVPIFAQFTEYDVKAQFMHRFTQFIEWPKGSTINNSELPFRIGVYGENYIENPLNEIAEFYQIKDKKVKIAKVDFNNIIDCDMLFISKCSNEELDKIIKIAKGKGILLVSDTNGYGKKGVHINFYKQDEKINFEINITAAKNDTFNVSSRLLKLARIIEWKNSKTFQ